jgi:DNA-binding NarL/FixJ family response regulator
MSALTAIVCDDDPQSRQSVIELASECGFEVVGEFDLAVSAVAVAELTGADVVVLDLTHLGMSSLKAIPLLRDAAPGCDVIVCAAYETVRPAALREGASEVVAKGDRFHLEQVLRGIAHRRSTGSEVASH